MAEYDQTVIHAFADQLYTQASHIVWSATAVGIIVGGVIGTMFGTVVIRHADTEGAVVGAVLCGLVGLAVGQSRAFSLKLQAQTALCQAQIEENTRRAASPG